MTFAIEAEWLKWARDVYIVTAIESGCFVTGRVLRLLDTEDDEGPTYAIQLEAAGRPAYDNWINGLAEPLMEEAFRRWGNQFIAFKSLLSIVN